MQSLVSHISGFAASAAKLHSNPAYAAAQQSDPLRVSARDTRDKDIGVIVCTVRSLVDFAEIELSILKNTKGDDSAVQTTINAVRAVRTKLLEPGTPKPNKALVRAFTALHDGGKQQIVVLVNILRDAMAQTEQQAQPKNPEARRLLRFFMASLFNPQMKSPAPLHQMMSMTTLVPHYAEDVIYALDGVAVEKATGVVPRVGEMTDLVTPTGFEVSIAEYLRVVNGSEWDNFVERVLAAHAAAGGAPLEASAEDITELSFLAQSPLAAFANDLMMWASQRGQLLSRTTRGMLLYEKALRVMAVLEDPSRVATDSDERKLQALLESKYLSLIHI